MSAVIKNVSGQEIVKVARTYLGAPFKLHGRDKRGIDCVGLIVSVAKEFGLAVDYSAYDLDGLKFGAAERLLIDHGCVPITVAEPGAIFTARNLMLGTASGVGIVSEVHGPALFGGVSKIIHCETPAPGFSVPRMSVIEASLDTFDVLSCQLAGVSAETLARAFKFYRFGFVRS